jgi:uncharacterized protein
METMIRDFLQQKRIAVVGVSRTDGTANLIYRKLRDSGYEVYAINPNAAEIEGDPCYADLQSTPAIPEGAVLVTRPEVTDQVVRQCAEAGIPRVWLHSTMVPVGSSVSQDAVTFCRENGIEVIAGACPMMFVQPVDFGHRCMRWFMDVTGQLRSQQQP